MKTKLLTICLLLFTSQVFAEEFMYTCKSQEKNPHSEVYRINFGEEKITRVDSNYMRCFAGCDVPHTNREDRMKVISWSQENQPKPIEEIEIKNSDGSVEITNPVNKHEYGIKKYRFISLYDDPQTYRVGDYWHPEESHIYTTLIFSEGIFGNPENINKMVRTSHDLLPDNKKVEKYTRRIFYDCEWDKTPLQYIVYPMKR